MREVTDVERRARLAVRHAIAPDSRVGDPVSATRAVGVLHATEPATVYLSVLARVHGLQVADVDAALYDQRSLVKQLAMRRTLFVFPRDLLPAAWGSASARVAGQLRARLVKEIEQAGIAANGEGWLAAACRAVEDRLADGSELSAQALREELPELDGRVELGVGKAYGGSFPIAPRVLTQLGVEARIVRGRNAGHWRVSRPQWAAMAGWLGEPPVAGEGREGYARLVAAWLAAFGPGTRADLQWWLGATAAAVTRALADVEAVEVGLAGGRRGWLLPDDVEPVRHDQPWAALLPVLDPTVMGWKERDFYLGPHGAALFDRNGNAGTTAWWCGRAVGTWVQDDGGRVVVRLLEDVGPDGVAALDREAERLTEWLAGVKVGTVYPSPAMKAAVSG